jgi:hypothetical protein
VLHLSSNKAAAEALLTAILAKQRKGRQQDEGKPDPWTNGQVERMNRIFKEAAVRRYHYETNGQLAEHLAALLDAYNFAKRLKTPRGLTPYERICNAWADQPSRFRYDPTHLTTGLNTRSDS